MSAIADELWRVARRPAQVDADDLARAVELAASAGDDLDTRTRILIRDSLFALRSHWGTHRFDEWLRRSPVCEQINRIWTVAAEGDDNRGFQSLSRRIVDAVKADDVLQYLRELAHAVHRPTRLLIGGSIALVLGGYLARHTDDIDAVDEVPAEIRAQHALLDQLMKRYGLRLAHFQSHYLPTGWEDRVHSIGVFGQLQVFALDVYDVFLGKLFSSREKDRDDLRAVVKSLDPDALRRRFHDTTAELRGDPKLLDAAERNWFVLFGEELPS